MSGRVLIIPEDPTMDHYVLQPVITAACRHVGNGRAIVRVLRDPAVQGVDQALSREFIHLVISRHPMVDLFLICVDRDGKGARDEAVANRVCERRQRC